MGGVNPYTQKVTAVKPSKPFKVTFVDEATGEKTEFVADPSQFPYGHTGLEGGLLDIAEGAGVEIGHACGGVCACATCHVIVRQGLASCSKATDDELDQLDAAPGLEDESRLSCQCVPNGTADLVVLVPKWNRNQVQEGHGG